MPFRRLSLLQLVLVALAFAGQMLAGAAMPATGLDAAALLGLPGTICHVADPVDGPPPAPHRHDVDCALCPACLSLAAVAILLAPPAAVPTPPVRVAERPASWPVATGPPARRAVNPQPRGPPAQV